MHRIVGLDIASDRVGLVALESGFRGFEVKETRSVAMPEGATPGERLKRALAALELVPPLGAEDTIAVAMPGAQVASHLVTLPFNDARRIEQVLPAEVEGAIPFEVVDVVWDHAVLSQTPGRTEVLVCIVRKTVLKELLATLASAGLDPKVVTFGPLALSALAERQQLLGQGGTASVDDEPIALLDAGPGRADLALLEKGKAVIARALATSSPTLWEEDPAAREKLLTVLARDLKITLRSRRGLVPSKLLLAGAIAGLPDAVERLGAELQIPIETIALQSGAPGDALALGLALRAQQPRGHINFRKAEFAFTKDLSQVKGQLGRLAVAATVLLLLAFGLGVAHVGSLRRQATDYDDALCAATKRILGTCMTDYRQAIGSLSGGKSKAAGIPRVSAADVMAELTAHLPEESLPILDDLDISTTTIRIKGVADSFSKVDEVTSALKKDKCFGEIKQPRSEKQAQGSKINFSLDFAYVCSGELGGGA
jgi:general secretion pathway protein L